MAKTITLQSGFTAGELDPRLSSRTDINAYYAGVAEATNVLCTPQGGLKRRPGMAFIHDIGLDGRLASFSFNTEQTYLLVFTNLQIEVFKDDVAQATIVTPWTLAQLPDLRFTQSADTMILTHEDHAVRKLVRGASHTSWTLSTISFSHAPRHNFDDSSSPVMAEDVQELDLDGETSGLITLETNGEVTANIALTGVAATNAGNIKSALEALSVVEWNYTVVNSGGGAGGTYTVTSQHSSYMSPIIGVKLNVTPSDGIVGTHTTEGTDGDEFAWSAGRGYPRSVCFHQGRLVFGGAKSRPATLWASVTNSFFNFFYGTGLDDEAIGITLDTDQVNAISAVVSTRHLQIFTSGGEFSEASTPLTPASVTVTRHTQYGSIGLQPVLIDGATLYVERRGKAVREYLFQFTEDAYTSAAISLMAPHLLNTPVDMISRRATDTDDANLLFVVNTDGTMAVLNTLRSENVAGWSKWETDGDIKSVASVDDVVYFLVDRNSQFYLEKADEDTYTDSNINGTQASSVTITGLTHLNGDDCRVRFDEAIMENATPSGGSVTMSRAGVDYEVGLNFNPLITTMPLNVSFDNGPTLLREKRITRAQVDLYESNGVILGGKRLPDRTLDGPLPDIPVPYTGMKETWLTGWSNLAQVSISQVDPLPMFIRSLALSVEAN